MHGFGIPRWFGNIQCRAVGSAKLCKGAKGGEGVEIWNVEKITGAQLEHVGTWEAMQQETSVLKALLLQLWRASAQHSAYLQLIVTREAQL